MDPKHNLLSRNLVAIFSLLLSLVAASPVQREGWNSYWYDAGFYGAYVGQHYRSFDLVSPRVNFHSRQSCDPGYTFLSPRGDSVPSPGPMILDANGELVWMEDTWGQAMDFRVQEYEGEDYLTFWRGIDSGTHGLGTYLMLNSSYDVVYEVKAANGLDGDLHEFNILGTSAVITVYEIIPADLSAVGGPADGWIYDGLFQEIDIATGELLFQWRASDHYRVEDSFAPLYGKGGSEDDAWDFFHINAVDKDDRGNYYISARYTHTITCISPTGQVNWILGGKNNNFQDLSLGAATNFSWQHHVDWHPGNILTIFDNGAYDEKISTAEHSRGLKIALDVDAMTATLLQDYINPTGVLVHSQGSVQIRPSGNVVVGWGHTSGFTEFTEDGQVVCDAHFGANAFFGRGWVKSYRGFKGDWIGMPSSPPSLALHVGWHKTTAFVSWNGATEVIKWRLEKADSSEASDEDFVEIKTFDRAGFETHVDITGGTEGCIRMVALDEDLEVLGYTQVLDVSTGREPSEQDGPMEDSDLLPVQVLMAVCFFVTIGIICSKIISGYLRRNRRTEYIMLWDNQDKQQGL